MTFLDDWKIGQTAIPKNEIKFFRFFAELLSKHHKGVHYYEVHGNPGHVSFSSGLWPTKPPVTKELGDLIIITYDYGTMQARYTINQNKFQKTTGTQRVWPAFKFKADIHQYDLLAFRPEVEVAGSIPFPKSILSGTNYNSVGSYGVFYEGEGHLIDFIYSIAKWLSPQSYVNSCNLILNTFQNEMSFAGRETICTVGIEKFLKHLLGMKIGAPVSTPEIGGFLNSLIRKAAEEAGEEPPVVDIPVFNEYISDENRSIGGGFRLLLINVGDNA
ncbi:hypothetical protein [Vreelandella titanicae]|uniref:hypothetical protein n=2 Tax=Vreelandella titanicae TaxID=664683 RepID=UPI0039BFFF1C